MTVAVKNNPPLAVPLASRRALTCGINQSLKEYRRGNFAGPFATAEEFLADLHRETANLDAKKRKRPRK